MWERQSGSAISDLQSEVSMVSSGVLGFQRRKATFSLAALLLLVGLLALALIISGIPAAHADGPVLTISSGVTTPGGEVNIDGTGWAPAKHYYLYVYGQSKCSPQPICPPPSPSDPYLINPNSSRIDDEGNLSEFTFKFKSTAGATTYVFTVVTTDTNVSQSVLVKVVPAGTDVGTPTPVSSSPTPVTPTAQPTSASASPTTTSQGAGGTGGQGTNTGGGNTLAIILVVILLIIAVAVLIGLLIVLPPKRRAIRAAWYGASSTGTSGGYSRYGASGPMPPAPRRSSGYVPGGQQEQPWIGGVAQWDEPPRGPRGSSRPRRPQGGNY
jgi:hypothetical protein